MPPNPLVSLSEPQRAYFAGLIDGEGYITAVWRAKCGAGRQNHTTFYIQIAVTMVERAPLDALSAAFGGKVYALKAENERWRPAFRYQVTGAIAETVIEAIRPYLLIKGRQADKCMELRSVRLEGGRSTPERRAEKEVEFDRRRKLIDEIRALNRRGTVAA